MPLGESVVFWEGQTLKSPISFDTETELIKDELTVPRLSLMTVSDGESSFVVHSEDVGDFIKRHSRHRWYGYNVAFDFWVLASCRSLWDVANDNRLFCLRLLRRLLKLAETGVPERQGTLADACREYAIEEPDKSDPYRLRYGELIGLSKEEILAHPEAQGFLSYALFDSVVTWRLIKPMEEHARQIGKKHEKEFHKDHLRRFGLLSVGLQTRADVVTRYLSRQPLRIDSERLSIVERETREKMSQLEDELESGCPGIWRTYKKTGARMQSKTGLPKLIESKLFGKLEKIGEEHDRPLLQTSKGKTSKSAEGWARWVEDDWVARWYEYAGLKKRLGTMLLPMKAGVVYANYETLLKTGRTSASKHKKLASLPIQQAPRDADFRALFLADQGTLRVTIDYSYLELRTLAACCLVRYGESKLAEAVRRHTEAVRKGRRDVPDPHELTASYILRLTPEEFLKLPKEERKKHRQKAKAANFGFPGGLGVARFVDYAKNDYGVVMTKEEAKALKETWLDAYPEMRRWLSDATEANLACNLGCSTRLVRQYLGSHLWHAREAIEGSKDEEKARGVIEALKEINKSPDVALLLKDFDYSSESHEKLADLLLKGVSTTPTGRVRGKVGYSDSANNPFQGLAADGAKEALWRLLYAGYPVKAFIHDEILIDLPEKTASRLKPRIHKILDEAMEGVMGNGVPCMSESQIGTHWKKG
jgi:hypothetical protein